MLLYEVKNIIKIFYEEENELVIHEWLEYNPEDQDHTILIILQKIYDIFLTYQVKKVIVKTNMTKGIFTPYIQKYIEEVQFPRLMENTKLRYIATVKSKDKIQATGTLLWQIQFNEGADIILHDVESEAEAREWLKLIAAQRGGY